MLRQKNFPSVMESRTRSLVNFHFGEKWPTMVSSFEAFSLYLKLKGRILDVLMLEPGLVRRCSASFRECLSKNRCLMFRNKADIKC